MPFGKLSITPSPDSHHKGDTFGFTELLLGSRTDSQRHQTLLAGFQAN
jgi:hypothetical protein